jgi:hypothetical protein
MIEIIFGGLIRFNFIRQIDQKSLKLHLVVVIWGLGIEGLNLAYAGTRGESRWLIFYYNGQVKTA